jgi:hypothetical protein
MRTPSIALFGAPAAGAARRFLSASLATEIGLLLVLSLMFPFLIHLLPVPEDARPGPRLLPMFYAPLIGALLGRTWSAVAVAVAAPWLNWLLTTHPAPRGAIVMTVQLLVFVAVVRALLRWLGARSFLAVPAYFAGMAASMLLIAIWPELNGGRPVFAWASGTVAMALPGVAVLVLVNWLALRFYPPSPGGGPPVAA